MRGMTEALTFWTFPREEDHLLPDCGLVPVTETAKSKAMDKGGIAVLANSLSAEPRSSDKLPLFPLHPYILGQVLCGSIPFLSDI